MKCHILFSEKNKKNISKCRLLKILPRVLSVKYIVEQFLHNVLLPVVRFSCLNKDLGPVVQSIVNLTSSLRVISLTILADSVHNILIFFAEKM